MINKKTAKPGELWGVYCEDFGEKWLRFNDNAMYFQQYNGRQHFHFSERKEG